MDESKAHSNQMRTQLGPCGGLGHRCTCHMDMTHTCTGTTVHCIDLLSTLMKFAGFFPPDLGSESAIQQWEFHCLALAPLIATSYAIHHIWLFVCAHVQIPRHAKKFQRQRYLRVSEYPVSMETEIKVNCLMRGFLPFFLKHNSCLMPYSFGACWNACWLLFQTHFANMQLHILMRIADDSSFSRLCPPGPSQILWLHGKAVFSELPELCRAFSPALSQSGWSTTLGGCCLWHRLNYAYLFEGTRETFCKLSPNSVCKWLQSRVIHLIPGCFI
jgi:hypothetical protein